MRFAHIGYITLKRKKGAAATTVPIFIAKKLQNLAASSTLVEFEFLIGLCEALREVPIFHPEHAT